jgi:hypothetical protein
VGEVPAAVSVRVAAALSRPPRPAVVLAAFPTAVYLGLDRHDEVLPVVARDALLLPTAVRVAAASNAISWDVAAGDTAVVGAGRVALGRRALVAARTWRPRGVPVLDHPPIEVPGTWAGMVSIPLVELTADVVMAAVEGRSLAGRVRGLVGAGAGLTPSGDDGLCGALLVLLAAGHPAAAPLAAAVTARLDATTSLSASLLREAMEGYAVPAVVRLVSAAVGGQAAERESALADVLAIGHTSGADVAAGVLAALDVLSRSAVARRSPVRGHRTHAAAHTSTGGVPPGALPLPQGAVHD